MNYVLKKILSGYLVEMSWEGARVKPGQTTRGQALPQLGSSKGAEGLLWGHSGGQGVISGMTPMIHFNSREGVGAVGR